MTMPDQPPSSEIIAHRIAVRTAAVAAVFSLIVAALMLYDFFHRSLKDPSQNSAASRLEGCAKQQPANESIIVEIRKLERESREELFRQQAFTLSGAGLLCGGIIVSLAAAKWAATLRRRPPQPPPDAAQRDWEATWTPAARWTVAGLFVVLAATAVGLCLPLHATRAEKPDGQVAAAVSGETIPGMKAEEKTVPAAVPIKPAVSVPAQVAGISEEELARAWPCFRGRGGSGISPYSNVPDDWDGLSGKNIVWKSPVPLAGDSSPVVVAGRIFLTGADASQRQVFCYDANKGRLLWQRDVPSTPDSRKPMDVNGGILSGYAACTMASDGRYVAAIFANGDLGAFDLDGKLAWSQSLGIPENPYGHAASLAIYKNLLLVPFDQASPRPPARSCGHWTWPPATAFGSKPARCQVPGARPS